MPLISSALLLLTRTVRLKGVPTSKKRIRTAATKEQPITDVCRSGSNKTTATIVKGYPVLLF